MKRSNSFYIFGTSIFGHGVLLLLMCIYFDFSKSLTIGDPQSLVVTSYLSLTPALSTEKNSINEENSSKKIKMQSSKLAIKPVHQSSQHNEISLPSKQKKISEAPSIRKGEPISELLALLHAAIQKQQHYPVSAQELEREGRATLKFILYPNGTISQLQIVKSSGTTSLDDAALAAIKNATPFAKVEQYLQSPHEYSIDVVFELT